jgi:hypothetical protein
MIQPYELFIMDIREQLKAFLKEKDGTAWV